MNVRKPRDQRGFTLIEVVVAVAVVAILAGTIVPLAFKQMLRAREDATRNELAAINAALVEFYEDTGRLPTEAEGLAALVNDPGAAGWQGPYVGGNGGSPVDEVSTDEFGNAYVYDFNPSLTPAAAADAVVVSAGADAVVGSGSLGGLWNTAAAVDDLLTVVSAAPVLRAKTDDAAAEMEAIAQAARLYFEQNAAFPLTAAQLSGSYLDPGIAGDAFADPWNSAYALVVSAPAGAAPWLAVRSWGPDRQDDGGGDDDLQLVVSGEPPGRNSTNRKLAIVQSALNANPSLALTGNWLNDRASLGLDAAFDSDGWGRVFALNVSSRTVFSAGPDGSAGSTADNIPGGVGP
ncbi:type II secretion system protein GspG [bacterium]|nr:type II secretion system protein GspG [bacterium]